MRQAVRWVLRLVALVAVIGVVAGVAKREEIARLLAVNSLFEADRIVANFSNMDRAFLTTPVDRGDGPVSALPPGPDWSLPGFASDWIETRAVTGLVILKDGALLHESYHRGTDAADRRISWSVAKSYLSTLVGVLLAEGAIASLDDPVTKYAPKLVGSAYDGASLRNVLNMASGVRFNEDYMDYESDINRMGREIALGGTLDDFTAALDARIGPPGTRWKYVSIDTHVIGMVIRGATGRSIADLLSEKIIAPLGLESEPYYLTDGAGVAFVLGGLNQPTRDYARFGQMIAQNGIWQGKQVVPATWISASTAPTAPTEPGARRYGYQWWIPADAGPGEFYAIGVYGQYIYIDQAAGVVIAVNAADRNFRSGGVEAQNIDIFRRIAATLP